MVDSLGPFLKVPFRSHHVGGPTHELMPNLFALRLEHYSEQHVYNHNQSGQRQRRSHRHEKTFHHRAVPQNPAPTTATLRTDCVMLPPCCRKDPGTSLAKPKYQWHSSRVTAAMQAGELIDHQVACATRRCSRDAN